MSFEVTERVKFTVTAAKATNVVGWPSVDRCSSSHSWYWHFRFIDSMRCTSVSWNSGQWHYAANPVIREVLFLHFPVVWKWEHFQVILKIFCAYSFRRLLGRNVPLIMGFTVFTEILENGCFLSEILSDYCLLRMLSGSKMHMNLCSLKTVVSIELLDIVWLRYIAVVILLRAGCTKLS